MLVDGWMVLIFCTQPAVMREYTVDGWMVLIFQQKCRTILLEMLNSLLLNIACLLQF